MSKVIFISGSTDGIGKATAEALVGLGHRVLVHGRSPDKLERVRRALSGLGRGHVETYLADLASIPAVDELADEITARHDKLDVVINNAGVYKVSHPTTPDGLDVRFVVNAIAPYRRTQRLLPSMGSASRVVNLSSAAQAPVDLRALAGQRSLSDNAAYAQSKLALTMWSRSLGLSLAESGPMVVAVNPGSLLSTKMVIEAFGTSRADVHVGSDVLVRAALSEPFAAASGQYFDNDDGRFAPPHPDALDPELCARVVHQIETLLEERQP